MSDPLQGRADAESDPPGLELPATVRTTQIVVGSVALGAMTFFVVALLVRRGGWAPQPPGAGRPIVSYVALLVAISTLGAQLIIPGAMVTAARRRIAAQVSRGAARESSARARLATLFTTKSILAAGIVEGGALFAIIAVMIDGWLPMLAVTAALIATVLSHFPSQSSAQIWIDDQLRRLTQDGTG